MLPHVCQIHQQVLFERMVYKTFFQLDLDRRICLVFHVYWNTLKGSRNEWHWVCLNDLRFSKKNFLRIDFVANSKILYSHSQFDLSLIIMNSSSGLKHPFLSKRSTIYKIPDLTQLSKKIGFPLYSNLELFQIG